MQTFLPYESVTLSAQTLDRQRLGKQRVETYQILNVLLHNKKGWSNHPAVNMWRGYEQYLILYGQLMSAEWIARGYKDTMFFKFSEMAAETDGPLVEPWWLGDKDFHDSHKSNLLRKDPEFYGKLNWDVPIDLPYIWPVSKEEYEARQAV